MTSPMGSCATTQRPTLAPDGRIDYSSLGLRVHLAPGESATLPIALAWHIPNLTNT